MHMVLEPSADVSLSRDTVGSCVSFTLAGLNGPARSGVVSGGTTREIINKISFKIPYAVPHKKSVACLLDATH